MKLSIVMPVRNEAAGIVQALLPLQELRGALELIVVDGQSQDATRLLAQPLADQLLESSPGRARQMNTGAAAAQGDWLLFLHADTRLPDGFISLLQEAQDSGADWGRFDVQLEPSSALLRLVARMINLRSRLTGVCTGDQAIFLRRRLFEQLGGYAEIPLMEDVELSKRLRRVNRSYCIAIPLSTSSRRWQQHGTLRTILLMWRLRLLYWLGVAPERLAESYRSTR